MARRARQVIEYRVYELDPNFPVLLLDGDNWRISPVKSGRLHFHNCLEIGVCHTDSGTLHVTDDPMAFRAGDVSCIPRHVPHTTYSAKGTASLWSYIFVDLRELLSDMVHTPEPFELTSFPAEHFAYLMNRDEHPRVHFLIMSILEELRTRKSNHRITVKALFIALFFELLRILDARASELAGTPPRKAPLVLTPALNHINVNYMNRITVDELAEMCHLSTTHFRRLFLSIMGSSPLSYINATRVERAATLLLTTQQAVLEISEAVGFASVSSFNRCFSSTIGMPPREFRNAGASARPPSTQRDILQYSGWFEPDP